MKGRGTNSTCGGIENAAPNDALFDESRWRLLFFRVMLPIGVLISIEQFVIAPTTSACFAAGFAALLLLILWLMAWYPKVCMSRWIDPLGDAFAEAVQAWLSGPPIGARIYRWGGEEFAVSVALQPGAALNIAEQLCAYIRGLVLPFGVRITVSIGGTVFTPSESVESAFQRADNALYEAKSAGRDRVVFLPSSAPSPSAVCP